MNLKEIKELIDVISEKDIQEFELERAGTRVRIRRGLPASSAPCDSPAASTSTVASQPAASLPRQEPVSAARPEPAEDLHLIKSPIVGTFYRSSGPGTEPFVAIGAQIEKGTVVAIIEAMKLMNEIESDVAGEIVKILVDDGQPVEYGEQLFAVRAR